MKWNLLFEQNVMFVVHRTYDQNMSEQEAKLEDLKVREQLLNLQIVV